MTLLSTMGQSQSVIYHYNGEWSDNWLGRSVSNAGDANMDGYTDIVAGAQFNSSNPDGTLGTGDEVGAAGRVYVYSGKDGTWLHTFDGERQNDYLGISVSGAGDVNLDGYADIVAAAYGYDPDPLGPDGTPLTGDEILEAGRVYAFSGKDGSTLWTSDGEHTRTWLASVSDAGDVNFDGYNDVVAGAFGYVTDPDGTWGSGDELIYSGRVYAYSGKDGTTLWTHDGKRANDNLAGR